MGFLQLSGAPVEHDPSMEGVFKLCLWSGSPPPTQDITSKLPGTQNLREKYKRRNKMQLNTI